MVDRTIWSKKTHAWVAAVTWCFLASFMVIVNRHIYGFMWRYYFWIHAVCGTLVFILNFGTSYYAWHCFYYRWIYNYAHMYFVMPLMFLLIIVVIHGIVVKKKQADDRWNTKTVLENRKWHRVTGYVFIHIGHWGVFTGGGLN